MFGVLVVLHCIVWLVMQGVLSYKGYQVWWAFSAAALWPVTFMLMLFGVSFDRFKVEALDGSSL